MGLRNCALAAQIIHICTVEGPLELACAAVHIGGSRAQAADQPDHPV
jgi:hypothetical protein